MKALEAKPIAKKSKPLEVCARLMEWVFPLLFGQHLGGKEVNETL